MEKIQKKTGDEELGRSYYNDSYLIDFLRIDFNQTLHNVAIIIYDRAWLEGISEHLVMGKSALEEKHRSLLTKSKRISRLKKLESKGR